MDCLDLTLPTPEENLALDEVLLLDAEAGHGGEVLRFWELPTYAVVLGVSGRIADDVNEAACQRKGVPIVRRCSGGGTVLLGPGCLCFSLVLSFDRSPIREITPSYCHIMGRIRGALINGCPGLTCAGSSDLAVDSRKVSGNSQRRMKSHLLHHGTIMYDFELSRISRFLKLPKRQPEYRLGRPHEAFVTNLGTASEDIKHYLRLEWEASGALTVIDQDRIQDLVLSKYNDPQWTRRL